MARLTLTLSEAVAVWQRGAGGGGAQAVLPADDLPAVRSARCALRAPDVAALSDAAAPWPLQRRHWRRRHRRRRLKAWHRGGAGVGRGGEPGEHGGRGVGRERGLRQLQAVGLATALEHAVVGVVAARGGEDDAVQRVALLGREFSLRKHVGHLGANGERSLRPGVEEVGRARALTLLAPTQPDVIWAPLLYVLHDNT